MARFAFGAKWVINVCASSAARSSLSATAPRDKLVPARKPRRVSSIAFVPSPLAGERVRVMGFESGEGQPPLPSPLPRNGGEGTGRVSLDNRMENVITHSL